MPPFTRAPKTETYGVRLAAGSNLNIFYCFLSRNLASAQGVSAADLGSQLGFFGAGVAFPAGSVQVFGCNAPKPPRVKKRLPAAAGQGASLSTFCAPGSLPAAKAAG